MRPKQHLPIAHHRPRITTSKSLIVLLLLSFASVSFASPQPLPLTSLSATTQNPAQLFAPPKRRTTERQLFLTAKKRLNKGDLKGFNSLSEKLVDYPLYPYLEFFKHKRYISKLSADDMEHFSQRNGDSPISYRLYNAWLASLAKNKRWKDYIGTYESNGKAKYDCYYNWALLKEGYTKRAFLGAEKLWLVGKSQVKSCDPLFEAWKKTDRFNPEIAWQRTNLAMQKRKLQLAKYLERFLKEPEKSLSSEWRRLYRTPKRLKNISRYQHWGDRAKPVIISGFKRLIRKDSDLAADLWPNYERAFDFSTTETAEIYQYFATTLALRFDDNAEYWLNQALLLPGGERIIDFGIRHALRSHDWQRVKRWLAITPQAERGSNQWRYWEAKSDQFIGDFSSNHITPLLPMIVDNNKTYPTFTTSFIDDLLSSHNKFMDHLTNLDATNDLLPNSTAALFQSLQTPSEAFNGLASERSYYGFLSSERLNQPLNLNNTDLVPHQDQVQRILSNPGIIRAWELYQIKEDTYARSEWNLAIARMPSEDRGIAAQLADHWGWHHHAIMAAARSDIRDNLKLRFPIAYQNDVATYASKNGIASDWVYSLIRQESAFSYQAKSPVGALGMMQLMPATAKQVSKSIGLRYKGKHSLLAPKKNIQLGTTYMSQLLRRFQGNTILATAAYNAGPNRVKRWQPKEKPIAGDIWIETIPYRETRNYVKNVMTYQAIYRSHLGQDIKLASSLSMIPPRSPQLVHNP